MAGLTTGDHVPNFELPDQNGNPWILSERLEQGSTVLVFYRGDW
jgi:peroxiredoxin